MGWHNGKPTGFARDGVKAMKRKFERTHRRSFGNKTRSHPRRWNLQYSNPRPPEQRPRGWFF